MGVGFDGPARPLFRITMWTGLVTLFTLGLYRFWMKTRVRRWLWSSFRPGGQPLEYTGDPTEKMMGFLAAMVVIALYVGVVNLILVYFGLTLFQNTGPAYVVSGGGLIMLFFFAKYRARRYKLTRTAWRGVTFGLDKGALAYARKATVWWAFAVLSAGLLMPVTVFVLERFLTDRTRFGDGHLRQSGSVAMLYPAAVPLAVGVLVAAAAATTVIFGHRVAGTVIGVAAAAVLAYGLVHFQVTALARLTEAKSLGSLGFRFDPSPIRVFLLMARGYALALIVVFPPAVAFTTAIVALQSGPRLIQIGEKLGVDLSTLAGLPPYVLALACVPLYFAIFLLWSALRATFVTRPIYHHYAERLQLTGTSELARLKQTPRAAPEEAEGFADALDIGASF
ncbi:DUF898 family protein [Litorisediminicola beolgyonensis]|uniref:DUF898 family protein n=1 Tax=Litorisediminicola beolgyonensis TaxID=1173614 RepID=A0ABW3ZKY7_9RHOB